ncbi:hypothetical protein [Sorangium sp. So ce861]|uniref:hypothetical protein n=1 Tax=Sorangium sp. So ce861 TaxID=3133323 RepID=UPI003F5E4203
MLVGLDFRITFGPRRPTPRGRRSPSESAWRALAALLLALVGIGCSRASSAPAGGGDGDGYETLELRYEAGTGVSFPELAQDLGRLAPIKLSFVGSSISGPHNIQSVVTGDTDFGGAFNGAVIAESEFQVWIDRLVRDGELKQGQVQLSELYTNEFNPFWKGGP